MTSERQRSRARRTEAFWRTKLDRAPTAFDRANTVYDRARAAVNDLPPAARRDGWAQIEGTIAELHKRWADERAVELWDRLTSAAKSPEERVWKAWRRLWAVVARLPEDQADVAWQAVECGMYPLVVTLSDVRADPNSGAAERGGRGFTRRRRGPAGVPRATRGNGTAEFGPKNTLRKQNHGRSR